jgi:FemAB-related protein (PEP-CTERM system-associated)
MSGIRPAAPEDTRWDAFIADRPEATYAHLLGWATVFTEALGHRWHGLLLERGSELEGVLPLVRVRSRIFGDYLMSMPFINYGGPVGSEDARRTLTEASREMAAELGVGLLELRNRLPLEDGLTRSDRKVTVLLDLPDDPEALWGELKAKVRSQVRRPMKEGMTALFGSDQLDAFYEVFSRNMRDLGTPVLPRRLFESMRDRLREHFVMCVIQHEGKPVAAGAGFTFGREFELTWASSLREANKLAPNMLLYWSLMEECVRREMSVFNFGRCTPGGGTHKFKLQWGGRDEPMPWSQWSPTGIAATPSPDSAKFRAAVAAWQRLPLPVADFLGPFLSRSIP